MDDVIDRQLMAEGEDFKVKIKLGHKLGCGLTSDTQRLQASLKSAFFQFLNPVKSAFGFNVWEFPV